jgi:hypothetical protein
VPHQVRQAHQVGRALDHGEGRGRHALVAHDMLGHGLVQGERHHQRIGEGIGDVVGIEQRRHLGLAADALEALGDIEDEVPALAGDEPRRQLAHGADTLGGEAEPADRGVEGIDGLDAVELRRRLGAVARGQVMVAQIVGQADAHQRPPLG